MRRHALVTFPVALFATVFMLGCEDAPVSPDVPDPLFHHRNGHAGGPGGGGGDDDGGKGGGKDALVDLISGVTTSTAQRIKKEADSPRKLSLNGTLQGVEIALATGASNCSASGGGTLSAEDLDQSAADRWFVAEVDRKGDRDRYRLAWPPSAIRYELFLENPAVEEQPTYDGGATDATITFTGGQVTMRYRPDDSVLTCDNGTELVLDVSP